MSTTFLNELLATIVQRSTRSQRRAEVAVEGDHHQLADECRRLLASYGEASSIAIARRALDIYNDLNDEDKACFFRLLAECYAPDPATVHQAYKAYASNPDAATLQVLFHQCEPPRQELLRRMNLPLGGTLDLVRMRADLQQLLPDPLLEPVETDFVHLFISWFSRGFLVLHHIDWSTSAVVLEKIIDYEAVHEIRDWDDLRRRLNPVDRRCFAFFHPAIGNEPLIFVEVALTRGVPSAVQPIIEDRELAPTHSKVADTAAFYGISNCQLGLRKISFGSFLIKQVVRELKHEMPNLKHFVTLSPIPGFLSWLKAQPDDPNSPLVDSARAGRELIEQSHWAQDPVAAEKLREVIMPLAANYLLTAKNKRGEPTDPVARFHLRNGARLHRINWLGDTSDKGINQGAGLMVNYLYVIDQIDTNHERYVTEQRVTCSSAIRKLARSARQDISAEATK